MAAINFVPIFYTVFLFIFCLTAIVTLGGILKWKAFNKIHDKYLKVLFTALLIELVGAVMLTYQSLPPIQGYEVTEYRWLNDYVDYEDAWISWLSASQRQCLTHNNPSDGSEASVACKEITPELAAIRKSVKRTGKGDVLLVKDKSTGRYRGLVQYTFPDAGAPISMEVLDGKKTKEGLNLTFLQSIRIVDLQKGTAVRRSVTLKIEFTKESDSEAFKGFLFHSRAKTDSGKPLLIANSRLIRVSH